MKSYKADKCIYTALASTVAPIMAAIKHVKVEKYKPVAKQALIVCNHTTDLDFVWIGASMRRHEYVVASDHIQRASYGKIMQTLFTPIWRIKSSSDLKTIKDIMKRAQLGSDVLVFPEGNRSINGDNYPIMGSIGKLAKLLKLPLITYKIEGGYFMQPRFAKKWRKGPVYCHPVNEYSWEELSLRSAEEITQIIIQDLHENAYERQAASPVAYKGKDLCEYLETVIYTCPECRQRATLRSCGDKVECACGFSCRIDEYGYFHCGDEPAPYPTVYDWDVWQKDELRSHEAELKKMDPGMPIYEDKDQVLEMIGPGTLIYGTFRAFCDRFEYEKNDGEKLVLPFESINEMQVVGRQDMMFSGGAIGTYEMRCDHPRSAYKYIDLYELLK